MCPTCLFIKGIFELGLKSRWKPIPPAPRARSRWNRLPLTPEALYFKESAFEIWPFSCDFNSELALAQPFYNQLASPLDL